MSTLKSAFKSRATLAFKQTSGPHNMTVKSPSHLPTSIPRFDAYVLIQLNLGAGLSLPISLSLRAKKIRSINNRIVTLLLTP